MRNDEKTATLRSLLTKIRAGKLGTSSLTMLIGGKSSESKTPANSNCDVVLTSDSVAMAFASPVYGKPSMR